MPYLSPDPGGIKLHADLPQDTARLLQTAAANVVLKNTQQVESAVKCCVGWVRAAESSSCEGETAASPETQHFRDRSDVGFACPWEGKFCGRIAQPNLRLFVNNTLPMPIPL